MCDTHEVVSGLAELIEARRPILVERWTVRLRDEIDVEGKTKVELRDDIPTFLVELVAELQRGQAQPKSEAAQAHGRQRYRLGFVLDQLVREYGLLRDVIFDLVEEAGLTVSLAEMRVLTNIISTAIAEAVTEHARQQALAEGTVEQAHLQALHTLLASERGARAEAEAERQKQDALFTQTPVAIAMLDGAEHVFTFANPAYRTLVNGRDVVGKPLLEALPDVREQGFAELLDEVMKSGETFYGKEVRITLEHHRGDERLVLNFVYAPKRNSQGVIDGVLMSGVDVTEQVLARERVEALASLLETIFAQSPAAMALWRGRDLVFEKANPEFAAIFGGRELIGRRLVEALPELAGQVFPGILAEVFDTGIPFVAREALAKVAKRKDGPLEERYYDFTYVRVQDAAGKAYGVYDHAVDVTDFVLARRKLEDSQRRLEALLGEVQDGREHLLALAEAIPQQVWTADAAGALDFVNQRVLQFFATTQEAVLGAGWQAFIHPEDLPGAGKSWSHSLATGEDYEVEFRLRQHDGAYRWHLARARPSRDAQGRVTRWFGTNTDIDEAKRFREASEMARAVEQSLRRDAEEANRAKDEFLAMLGHELRNPLAPISTALQLMALRSADVFANERTIIERQVAHMSRLVDDLLDVSRITTGKIELNRAPIEIAAVVANAVEIVSPLLEQKRHHLVVEVASLGLAVDADAVRIAQVLSNLITNAAKYTEAEGRIVVSAEREGDDVVVRVRDNGIGITPEMLPRIFDLFVQERQALDRSRGGLGLGLAIVRTLATLHGGSITAVSEGRDRGSEFTLRLPAAKAGSVASVPAKLTLAPHKHARRILVVDDNEDAADLLAMSLAMAGHETRVAHNGLQALEIVKNFAPQIAVLDIGLPVMDGYELARRLHQVPGLERLRLIALTGYGQATDRQRSAEASFSAHLVKPIQTTVLQALIDDFEL